MCYDLFLMLASTLDSTPQDCNSIPASQVYIPVNVRGNHWVLLVFNITMKEVQVLNSLVCNGTWDGKMELSLVSTLYYVDVVQM